MTSEIPTREKIQSELSEVIRLTYDTQKKQEKELQNAVNELIEFFFKETPPKQKTPYQYEPKNQTEFYKNANIVSTALSQVEPVLSDMKSRMYNLEKGNQVIDQTVPSEQPLILPPTTPAPKRPILANPFKKDKKPAPTNPYQSTIELQKKTEAVIYNWELVLEYQSFGVDLVDEFGKAGIMEYLTYHRNKFSWEVVPNILRIFKQGLELQLEKEKKFAYGSLTANMKESFSMRNDQQGQSSNP